MINSRILVSLASIVTAGSLMAGATLALFTDSGTSSSNVFATGTLDLKLSDSNETDQDSVVASFGGLLTPGSCTVFPQTLTVKNSGSIGAGSVKIAGTNSGTASFDQYIDINSIQFDGNPVSIADANANSHVDLQDLESASTITLPGGGLASNGSKNLVMTFCMDTATPNDFQGASNTLDLTVTLSQ